MNCQEIINKEPLQINTNSIIQWHFFAERYPTYSKSINIIWSNGHKTLCNWDDRFQSVWDWMDLDVDVFPVKWSYPI